MERDSSDETTDEITERKEAETDPARGTNPALELDAVFAALGHSRRRYLMYALRNGSGEASLPELAADIATWELEKPVSEVTEGERLDVEVSLYHSHVPKLSALDIVGYREAKDRIVRAVNTDQVQAVLDGAGAELDSRQETHARDHDDR